MAAPGPQVQQEITLLQERSAGTFARVYVAEATRGDGLSRIVAVKVLKTQWSEEPELLARTQDEARLLARLHHRNILRVEGLAELSGQPAIIMEFVDGLDLKQLIERTGEPIPPRAAYRIIRDASAALQAAYFRNPYGRAEPMRVVHRDIKPSNIMVSVEGEVKVLDFGTARYQNEIRLAQTGALRFGSLKYMSPERRAGDRGEHSSDIYALGLVLIEILLGEILPIIPLEAGEHDRYIAGQLARLPTVGMPNASWERSLKETLERMCSHDPTQRLDAPQVIELMRAFNEQASGDSLDTYAARTVTSVAHEIYGHQARGALTGARLLATLSTSSDRPAIAAPVMVSEEADTPAPEKHNKMLLIGVVAAIAGGGLLLVGAAGMGLVLWLLLKPEPPPQVTGAAPIAAAPVVGPTLSLAASDSTIQWLKLSGPNGQTVLKADPEASTSVPVGAYTLAAKVIARPVVSAELQLDDDLSLTCSPAPERKVLCEGGGLTLLLD